MKKIGFPVFIALAGAIPMIPILFVYSNNSTYLHWIHMLLTAAAFSFFSCILFFLLAKILKSCVAAFLSTIFFWLLFFVYSVIFHALLPQLEAIGIGHTLLIPLYAIVFFLFCWLSKRIAARVKLDFLVSFISVFTAILLVVNIFSFTQQALYQHNRIQVVVENNLPGNVDTTLSSPDIYWIHCDGMLSFKMVESLFKDDQADFIGKLEARGFVIDPDAQFEAR